VEAVAHVDARFYVVAGPFFSAYVGRRRGSGDATRMSGTVSMRPAPRASHRRSHPNGYTVAPNAVARWPNSMPLTVGFSICFLGTGMALQWTSSSGLAQHFLQGMVADPEG